MNTKNFKGKAIYTSGGPAAEYGKYGASFYVDCSNGCTYCYLKTKHPFKYACGGDIPTLKKYFKDESHALEIFKKELMQNLPELQKHGLFFSFTSDWALKECIGLNLKAVAICIKNYVPVKLLTKRADFDKEFTEMCRVNGFVNIDIMRFVAFGFTLTGRDDLEPNASTNAERIEAIQKLHEAGFKTWASIEPVIDFESSMQMIVKTMKFCNLYKIGTESGKKYFKPQVLNFIDCVLCNVKYQKIYFKDSILKSAGIDRKDLPSNCVDREYSLFNN